MNRLTWFATVVAVQAVLLLGWAGYHEWNRNSAPVIVLETAPVDPRDLLRGDYMILSYKITRVLPPAGWKGTPSAGREIWVSLRGNGRFHEVASTAWTRPESRDANLIWVRGRTRGAAQAGTLWVDYGIEKYFVPEGRGRPTFKTMVLEATVSRAGDLGIKRLMLDEQPYP